MGRNREVQLQGGGVEIAEPGPSAAFQGWPVATKARARRRTGGNVGHRVEGGVGVFAQFLEVAGKTGFQIGVEFRLLVIFPWFRFFWQLRPSSDETNKLLGFMRGDPD